MSKFAHYIGENIRNLRKERGLSQEQLALRAEINASYMGQVERGEKSPTIDVLGKIAGALHCSLEQIVGSAPSKGSEIDSSYADKIAHQMSALSVKEQEAVYKFVKQLIQFKELD
ncbi:helix-turn-helix domain-containing protein [Paenibacillus sp. NEAU-GSW1]|uniref:helix-turn-helix domain-containing protein n=1 Tax=Paenibacillus sp. NEAU-GSW1 TaxID=2682486 RepID=UPI0012E2FCEA|nr:helix-turn-helix transcriptional regulator [Paenibacillus sp. NEAU-GSW1]